MKRWRQNPVAQILCWQPARSQLAIAVFLAINIAVLLILIFFWSLSEGGLMANEKPFAADSFAALGNGRWIYFSRGTAGWTPEPVTRDFYLDSTNTFPAGFQLLWSKGTDTYAGYLLVGVPLWFIALLGAIPPTKWFWLNRH